MKVKLLMVVSILSMLLCACSVEGNEQTNYDANGISAEPEAQESEEQATEVQVNYDIQIMLEEAEAQAADLEKKLIEEIPYQEEETTITFIVEGLEEVVPAIIYEGENYSITVPKEGWVDVTRGVWRSDINNQVQISVVDYTGENINSVCENLSDSGYIETEQNHMSVEDSNGLVWNVRLFTKGEKVVGVFYNYPKEAVEGFGSRLSVIVDTFEWR